ncbi:MAG: hypothetical protein V7K18_25200 [Nostoc sp.]|uniref:hypothetical protein n=1 Tax=Nostoc sp. TaxID=1180 RepID=UPI002FF82AF0
MSTSFPGYKEKIKFRRVQGIEHWALGMENEPLILADESLILADESFILADESLNSVNESLILADESLNSTPLLHSPVPPYGAFVCCSISLLGGISSRGIRASITDFTIGAATVEP